MLFLYCNAVLVVFLVLYFYHCCPSTCPAGQRLASEKNYGTFRAQLVVIVYCCCIRHFVRAVWFQLYFVVWIAGVLFSFKYMFHYYFVRVGDQTTAILAFAQIPTDSFWGLLRTVWDLSLFLSRVFLMSISFPVDCRCVFSSPSFERL